MKNDILYTIHIRECIDRIREYTGGIDHEQFMASSLIQDAVLRNLQVLAESTQRLSDEFKSRHPEIEWHKISGLRNILVMITLESMLRLYEPLSANNFQP